jgi:hypothetical protein
MGIVMLQPLGQGSLQFAGLLSKRIGTLGFDPTFFRKQL